MLFPFCAFSGAPHCHIFTIFIIVYYFTDIIGNHQASTVRDAELNQIYRQLKGS